MPKVKCQNCSGKNLSCDTCHGFGFYVKTCNGIIKTGSEAVLMECTKDAMSLVKYVAGLEPYDDNDPVKEVIAKARQITRDFKQAVSRIRKEDSRHSFQE